MRLTIITITCYECIPNKEFVVHVPEGLPIYTPLMDGICGLPKRTLHSPQVHVEHKTNVDYSALVRRMVL